MIFGIGLPKTGTTTLGAALTELGYTCSKGTDTTKAIPEAINDNWDYLQNELDTYTAFKDSPYHEIWIELYCKYPDAKFILTTRKCEEVYLNSLLNEPERKKNSPIHHQKKMFQFGVSHVEGNEGLVMSTYIRHNQKIRDFFYKKSNFIEVCWDFGDGWHDLCEFLDKPIPNKEFPHLNKRKDNV